MKAALFFTAVLAAPAAAEPLETCLDRDGFDACYGRIVDACLDALPEGADSTHLNAWKENDLTCWAEEHAAWDALLNQSYRDLRAAIDQLDPAAAPALQKAQRAWIALRDADCAWPETFLRQNTLHHHVKSCQTRATAERAAFLRDEAAQWSDW